MAELTDSTINEQRKASFTIRGRQITYRQKSDTVNRKTGTVTESNTDTIISSALIGSISQQEINNSGGKYYVGDKWFVIKHSDMPETPPVKTSQIVYSSDTYEIIEYERSGDTNIWRLLGRKV